MSNNEKTSCSETTRKEEEVTVEESKNQSRENYLQKISVPSHIEPEKNIDEEETKSSNIPERSEIQKEVEEKPIVQATAIEAEQANVCTFFL